MMTESIFKKSIFVSLIGHIAVFSIFSFSFGGKLYSLDYGSICFLGAVLKKTDLSVLSREKNSPIRIDCITTRKIEDDFLDKKTSNPVISNKEGKDYLLREAYLKPQVDSTVKNDSKKNIRAYTAVPDFSLKKESVFMFHPVFPAHFSLYFKDRQAVHIELIFNIKSEEKNKSIVVKRKISSGNLDVDLLSMRYISHFLFIQQARFVENNWQKVKIEFSPNSEN